MTAGHRDYFQGRAQAQRVKVPGAHGGHVYVFGDPQHPVVLEPFPSAALTTKRSQGTQGLGTPRLASSALRTRPASACMSPGQGPRPRTPCAHAGRVHGGPRPRGPTHLCSSCRPRPGRSQQGRSRRSGRAHCDRNGSRGWGRPSTRPCLGGGGAGGLRAQALRPAGPAAGPSQAERPPSSTPGQGQGAHPHKTLPGCPARSLLGSRFHSLLQGKENRP